MPLIRPTALRSLQSTLRYSGARVASRAAPARTQLVAKRFSSSGGHGGGHGESSDMPWLLAALAITPPSCWYLWPDNSSHGHDDHGAHGDHHEEKEESHEEPAEEEAPAAEEEAGDDADEKKDDKPEGDEEKSEDKKEDKSDEKEEKSDEKEEKSDEKEEKSEDSSEDKKDEPEEKSESGDDNKETKSDSKNRVNKKESTKAQTLGETDSRAASAKPPGKSDGDMSKKQEGMSNTDTKYSVPIDQGTEKSKKGDGTPDTAKSKGTIDPKAEGPKPPVARDD